MSSMRLVIAATSILALSGCVVAPAPYPAYSYGYGPGYYGPAYVAGPTVAIGGGWGWGGRGRWRRW
jgi:hypothetical protein